MDVESLTWIPEWEWPEEAGAVLREALADAAGDEEERLLAAELAGSIVVMDDALAGTLLEVVRSPEEGDELRGRAAIALGPVLEEMDLALWDDEYDEPPVSAETERAIRATLRDAYLDPETPKLVRRRVLEASIRAREEWHPGAVRAAYHADDTEWRITAVFCMGWVPGFEDEILEALESGEEPVRFEAVRAAGLREVEGAWTRVRAHLRFPGGDRDLLLAAVEASGTLCPPEEAHHYVEPLLDSEDEELVAAAEEALTWIRMLSEDPLADPDGEGPWGA